MQISLAVSGGGRVTGHDRADDWRGAELPAQVPALWVHPQGLPSREGGHYARGTGASAVVLACLTHTPPDLQATQL